MRTNRWFNWRRAASVLVAWLFVCGVAPPPAAAQCELAKLLAFDGAAGDNFGVSVSISGDVAVVGAHLGDGIVADSGSAYVFRFNGSSWVQEAKLTASDGAAVDQFGISVSISGDVAVVGARRDDDNGSFSGSAYVFVGLLGLDYNGNGVADVCEALSGADITGPRGVPDGCVDAFDLGALLGAWCSVAGGNPCGTCGP